MTDERIDKEEQTYADVSNVETGRDFFIAEELPEGPYGSPINKKLGKTSPWHEGQRPYSAYNYEFKSLHQHLPRKYPGAHPTHDDPNRTEEPPYSENKHD